MEKQNLRNVAKEIFVNVLLTFVFYLLAGAKFYNVNISCVFSVSLLLSFLFVKINAIKCIPAFFVGNFLSNITFKNFLYSTIVISVFMFLYVFNYCTKKRNVNNNFKFIIFAILLFLPKIAIYYSKAESFFVLCFLIVLAIFASFVFIKVLQNFILRYAKLKYSSEEKLYVYIFLFLVVLGISNINLYGFEFIFFVATINALVLSRIFGYNNSVISSFVIAFAYAFATLNFNYVLLLQLYSLIALLFSNTNRLCLGFAVVVCDVFYNVFFIDMFSFNYFSFATCFVVGAFNLCLKNSTINKLKKYFMPKLYNIASSNYINKEKMTISNKLLELAEVFKTMKSSFLELAKGSENLEDCKKLILQDVKTELCSSCCNKNSCCILQNENTENLLNCLIATAYTRGKATLLDVSTDLLSGCEKINPLLAKINELVKSVKHSEIIKENINTSRLVVANELMGVEDVLCEMATSIKNNCNFIDEFQNLIKEELVYKNILCVDCSVVKKMGQFYIVVAVKNKFNLTDILKICECVVKRKCEISKTEKTAVPNETLIYIESKTELNFVFGKACKTKTASKISGDNKTAIKIDSGKYMLGILDGMGSGERANKQSLLALTLIEHFYKAGFSNEIIINCCNNLLNSVFDDGFSTIDLCALNFYSNTADFIKLGATNSFIKRNNKIIDINNSGLPLGTIKNIKPHITKMPILNGDYIIMFSDGVSDAFANIDVLKEYVCNCTTLNPQTIANEIVEIASNNYGEIYKDDMTVIVIKIFKN